MVKLIKYREQVFTTKFSRILYCVPIAQSDLHHNLFQEMQNHFPEIELIFDLPKISDVTSDSLPKLILLDDLMVKMFSDKAMEEMFTMHSHHHGVSIIFTSQNYFNSSKSKTIIRQCTYKVIFNQPTDSILLRNIGGQIKPNNPGFLLKIFEKLDSYFPDDNYKYILIDGNPSSALKNMNVRTHIFPNSDGVITPLTFFTE